MELLDYLLVLQRRKWVIVLTAIIAVVTTAVGVSGMPPTYSATTTLRVLTTRVGGTDYSYYDVQYASRLTKTYAEITTSAKLIEELKNYVSRVPKIDVEVIPETELIQISVQDPDPALAQYAANKLGELLINHSHEQYIDDSKPVQIYIVEQAMLPEKPSSISPIVLIVLGLILGILGGIGLAFLLDSFDSRLYSEKDIAAATETKVIGNIPKSMDKIEGLGIFETQLHVEAFRRLRTVLFSPAKESQYKSYLITSAVKGDGKSVVTANLGISIAQTEKKVIIVDANLRQPAQHKIFDLENTTGLSSYLKKDKELADIITVTDYPGVSIITSGQSSINPVEMLSSTRMNELIEKLGEQYDVVLIDSPSSLSVTDPAVIAAKVDAVILVLRTGWVRRVAVQSTKTHLQSVNANLVGVIANRTEMGTKSRFSKVKIKPAESS